MLPVDALMRAVVFTAVVTAILSLSLVILKIINRWRRRWHGVRVAQYVAAVGEILTGGRVPERVPPGWGEDPAFAEVLVDYASNLAGEELETLEQLIERLDLRRMLIKRMRRGLLGSRLKAAAVLGEIPGSEGERALLYHLNDRSPLIRLQAARGLARIGHLPVISLLLRDIHRQSDWMAVRIADLLTGMGTAAVPVLVEHLTEDAPPKLSLVSSASSAPLVTCKRSPHSFGCWATPTPGCGPPPPRPWAPAVLQPRFLSY